MPRGRDEGASAQGVLRAGAGGVRRFPTRGVKKILGRRRQSQRCILAVNPRKQVYETIHLYIRSVRFHNNEMRGTRDTVRLNDCLRVTCRSGGGKTRGGQLEA